MAPRPFYGKAPYLFRTQKNAGNFGLGNRLPDSKNGILKYIGSFLFAGPSTRGNLPFIGNAYNASVQIGETAAGMAGVMPPNCTFGELAQEQLKEVLSIRSEEAGAVRADYGLELAANGRRNLSYSSSSCVKESKATRLSIFILPFLPAPHAPPRVRNQ